MWGWKSNKPTGTNGEFIERRKNGRMRCDSVRTVLGDVYDISIAGLRVHGKGRCILHKDQRVGFTLQHHSGTVALKSRVVWVRRCGFLRHDVGLEFIDINEDGRRDLSRLVMAAVPSHTLQPLCNN